MDAELVGEVRSFDGDVGVVAKPVALEIPRFFLFIVVVVRRNNVDLLAEPRQFFGQFIDHDSQTADWAPTTDLWGNEGDGSEGVTADHIVDAFLEGFAEVGVAVY